MQKYTPSIGPKIPMFLEPDSISFVFLLQYYIVETEQRCAL